MFKDHFSNHAASYAKHRPKYPKELFEYLASLTEDKNICLDVATGNGQAAVALADYFDQVIATDPSSEQISNAQQHAKVKYFVEKSEESEISQLKENSVDLITVATALHWFDFDAFYKRVTRIAKPNAIIAAWTYGSDIRSEQVVGLEALVGRYYDKVSSFWPPEWKYVREGYSNIPWEFAPIRQNEPKVSTRFRCELMMTVEQFENYLYTWSGAQKFIQARNEDPMECIRADLRASWGDGAKIVYFQLFLLIGRVEK